MVEKAIRDFPKQFDYQPVVENTVALKPASAFLVGAMGGSAHSSALLKLHNPELDIKIHRGYGLPKLTKTDLEKRLAIAISFSGNTEEVIDFYRSAKKAGLKLAVISKGGKLQKLARADKVPYIEIPETHIQPRLGLGFTLRAQMKLMGNTAGLKETAKLAGTLDNRRAETEGKQLAKKLQASVPVIYTSQENSYLGYVWKIKLNESAKIPSYHDVFSELNHNEMTGYDVIPKTRSLSKNIHFLFLRDKNDDPRIQKRIDITKKLYEKRGLKVTESWLVGKTVWERIFQSLLTADWLAYYLASYYGTEPEQVPMVEEFKKRMA
jgi:glucose/mannose-6-phosphate isomerase